MKKIRLDKVSFHTHGGCQSHTETALGSTFFINMMMPGEGGPINFDVTISGYIPKKMQNEILNVLEGMKFYNITIEEDLK